MPFDGSGNFDRALGPDTWQNDAAAGIKIKSDLHDNNDNDLASGLSLTITKDGQSSPTADITLNGHKLVNVANPTNPQDAMTLNAFAAAAVRYDVAQALTPAQQLVAHTNLAATKSVAVKAGAYTLLQTDRGKLLRITTAMTLTLPAASAVGNDFSVDFRTMGGVMTLDPNGTDQIEGVNADYPVPDNASGTLWSDGASWWVSTDTVAPKRTLVTVTNATFALDKATKLVTFELIPPGGGSGGVNGSGTGGCVGGGGGGGEYAKHTVLNPDTAVTWNIVIGAPGIAGVPPANGGTGGTTSITDGTTTVTAIGGTGGGGAGTGAVNQINPGGLGGTGGTGGDAGERIAGQNGGAGTVIQNVRISSTGHGGSVGHGWGLGGVANTPSDGDGIPGSGYGAGAAAAQVGLVATNFNGAAGQPGVVIVTEYK